MREVMCASGRGLTRAGAIELLEKASDEGIREVVNDD
jgi:hypothetical protein